MTTKTTGWSLGVTFLALALLLAGCATTGVNRGELNLVSLDEEWRLGQQIEQELARQVKLVDDSAALAYVSTMGRRIVQQTELGNRTWEFHVVADPSINAFNTPGGHVYVNTGLIMAADNAAELAGVMAHEIAHGVARHGTERISQAYGLQIGAGLLLGQNPSAVKQIATQIAAGGLVAKFSRDDEREADRLGVRYMHGAGYDPQGMATMFEDLLAERTRQPSSVERFFSTHPLSEERIQNVRAEAARLRRTGLVLNDRQLASVQQRVSRYQAAR